VADCLRSSGGGGLDGARGLIPMTAGIRLAATPTGSAGGTAGGGLGGRCKPPGKRGKPLPGAAPMTCCCCGCSPLIGGGTCCGPSVLSGRGAPGAIPAAGLAPGVTGAPGCQPGTPGGTGGGGSGPPPTTCCCWCAKIVGRSCPTATGPGPGPLR